MKNRIRKNSGNESGSSSKWLVTFNDLMTLLMVFFVLIFSMGSLDTGKVKSVQKSLAAALGVLMEGDEVSVNLIDKYFNMEDITIQQLDTDKLKVVTTENKESEEKMKEMIADSIKALDSEAGIKAANKEKGVFITLEDSFLFQFGKADINPKGLPVLDKVAAAIRNMPYSVRVEGHTDNVPIHNNRFYSNWELSTARAVNVVKYFVETGGIPSQRLSAVGYGESKPVFINDTPEQRARNRRVEIVLVRKEIK